LLAAARNRVNLVVETRISQGAETVDAADDYSVVEATQNDLTMKSRSCPVIGRQDIEPAAINVPEFDRKVAITNFKRISIAINKALRTREKSRH
jgi:hypothetical protein